MRFVDRDFHSGSCPWITAMQAFRAAVFAGCPPIVRGVMKVAPTTISICPDYSICA
jgi:hypothetical protein